MKNNSKDKPQQTNNPQNRLLKTQQPPSPKPDYLDSTCQGPKKQNATEKLITHQKQSILPPRAGSTQKINYKIEDNMTKNKIMEAKQGLQLLKKKMVRTGMSREHNDRAVSAEKRIQEPQNIKKMASKQYEREEREVDYGYQREVKKPTPQMVQKKPEEQPKKTPPIPSKSIEDRSIRKQPQREQFFNPVEQAPLKANQDFMAILEREMAKENAKNPPQQPIAKNVKKVSNEQENGNLIECSKGCGRSFNEDAVERHEKICEKVFQSKRKAYNSAATRQPDAEDFKQPPPITPIRQEKHKNSQHKGKDEKIPKWKLQSVAFRAGIKQGRGQELNAEQKAITQQSNGMVQCNTCGRKFNEEAGKRHIAFCESKAKQGPKMNTSKRK